MNCKLRPMIEEDLALVLDWHTAQGARGNFAFRQVLAAETDSSWWNSMCSDPSKRHFICESENGPFGFVGFHHISPENGTAKCVIHAKEGSLQKDLFAIEFLSLERAFGDLRFEKLTIEVLADEAPVVLLHRNFGFRVEGVRRRHHFLEGNSHDVILLSMTNKEWTRSLRHHALLHLTGEECAHGRWIGRTHNSEVAFSDSLVRGFCEVSGDANPIHLDEEAARAAGFPGRIVHGALLVARVSKDFGMDFPGPGTVIVDERFKFLKPLMVGEVAKISYRVLSAIGSRLIVEFNTTNAGGDLLMQGEAELLLRPIHT